MTTMQSLMTALDHMDETIVKSLDALSSKQRELADEILQLKQRGAHMPYEPAKPEGLGGIVATKMRENADLFGKTKSLRFETKAAGDVITTTFARNVLTGSVSSPKGVALGVHNAFNIISASGTTAHEYSRYLAVEGAAAVQAGEGAAKAAVRPTFSLITQTALTIAGYAKMSKQAVNDSAELKVAVDVTLSRSCATALDAALMSGSVTPAFDGLLTLATAYTSLVYNKLWDAASEAVSMMQLAGFQPDTIVLNPSDWLAVQVATNPTTDDYYSGSYLAPLPESLRGLRVIVSPTMTAGKVMVLDSAFIDLIGVDSFTVEVGYENDDFTKNVATILGEMRVIPVFRAVGAARLITPSA